MSVTNGLLPRRSRIDGIQRKRCFDEFLAQLALPVAAIGDSRRFLNSCDTPSTGTVFKSARNTSDNAVFFSVDEPNRLQLNQHGNLRKGLYD